MPFLFTSFSLPNNSRFNLIGSYDEFKLKSSLNSNAYFATVSSEELQYYVKKIAEDSNLLGQRAILSKEEFEKGANILRQVLGKLI
jgi:hypothetical protein